MFSLCRNVFAPKVRSSQRYKSIPTYTQTHKHTKTGRQTVPLLSHLWANSVTSPPLICHTHLRAFFCHTTWCLNKGSPSLRAMSVPQKMSQKFFSYFVPEKFLQVQSFIFLLWYPCSLKVRPEDMSGVAAVWEKKNLSKVNGRKWQRKCNGWAGAVMAEDNG